MSLRLERLVGHFTSADPFFLSRALSFEVRKALFLSLPPPSVRSAPSFFDSSQSTRQCLMASRSINEKLRDRQRELIDRACILSFIFRKSMHTRTWPSFFFTGTMLARNFYSESGCSTAASFLYLLPAKRHLLKMKWKKSRDSRLHVHFPLFSRHVCADESRSPIFLRPKVHLKEIINCSLSTFLELLR